MNQLIINMLKEGAENKKTVEITYKDRHNNISVRETEPYEIKAGSYWGFCIESDGIRKFNLSNILTATVTKNEYLPRWDVKI